MNLQTNRLIIRNLRAGDLADFVEYRSDPDVCKFQGYEPFTEEQAEKYIEKLKDGELGETGKWIQLGVQLKSENKLIGDIGLKPEINNTRIVEFGVSFSTKYQGKGYAKEALTRVFDYLFAEKNVHRIIAVVDVENVNMIRLLENMKFRREGHFLQSFYDNGVWRDDFLYAMLERDWKPNMNYENCILVKPSADLKPEFLKMVAEYQAEGEDRYDHPAADFEAYLERLKKFEIGENLPADRVPSTTYFLICSEKIIGRSDVRRKLNPALEVKGGHIGYDIRPSERRKGFGTLILKLTLEKAREIGLERVLITCDADNVASAKIIESSGGKLAKQLIYEETKTLISQYWIDL